jgi:hypothetical protein
MTNFPLSHPRQWIKKFTPHGVLIVAQVHVRIVTYLKCHMLTYLGNWDSVSWIALHKSSSCNWSALKRKLSSFEIAKKYRVSTDSINVSTLLSQFSYQGTSEKFLNVLSLHWKESNITFSIIRFVYLILLTWCNFVTSLLGETLNVIQYSSGSKFRLILNCGVFEYVELKLMIKYCMSNLDRNGLINYFNFQRSCLIKPC